MSHSTGGLLASAVMQGGGAVADPARRAQVEGHLNAKAPVSLSAHAAIKEHIIQNTNTGGGQRTVAAGMRGREGRKEGGGGGVDDTTTGPRKTREGIYRSRPGNGGRRGRSVGGGEGVWNNEPVSQKGFTQFEPNVVA